ncbi:MAG: DUF805 domain-containing protein [Chloroflexi bacterium]|nr:DUF805 domain-containing protein [Chloroflexota bacterium]
MSYCAECGSFTPVEQKAERSNNEMSFPAVLVSFRGRINRSTFWLKGVGSLAGLSVASIILLVITPDDAAGGLALFLFPVVLFMLYVWLAVIIKRLHDFDQPALWGLFFVPLIGPLVAFGVFIAAAFAEGTQGWNRYGDQP